MTGGESPGGHQVRLEGAYLKVLPFPGKWRQQPTFLTTAIRWRCVGTEAARTLKPGSDQGRNQDHRHEGNLIGSSKPSKRNKRDTG